MFIRLLSFASGIPALIYQVVWTREVSLLVGGQMEAISLVVVAFFGGLALGARALGALVDRVESPIRAYGVFEILAGAMALLSIPALRWLGTALPASGDEGLAPVVGVFLIFPITFLLGGTTPALMRASVLSIDSAARHAGGLTGVNTAGSVVGVCAAVWLIPAIGLQSTMTAAAIVALLLGVLCLSIGGRYARPELAKVDVSNEAEQGAELLPLVIAFVAGTATIGFEVAAARMAGIQLGSSLYAWGAVLACTLMGLAAGNFATAKRAATSLSPMQDLARIEIAAAAFILLGLLGLAPNPTSPSTGVTVHSMLIVAFGVLPPAFAMGGAFPYFVRIFVKKDNIGQAFGTVSACNTAGGISGALFSSFYLLPAIGPSQAAVVFAAINGLLGLLLHVRVGSANRRMSELATSCGLLLLLSIAAEAPPSLPASPRLIYLGHGPQATAAVLLYGDRRDLVVDGDPEASTASAARATEEFLAILPVMLHSNPTKMLEVGLGSGTTFGTASRMPLEELECIEIASSVIAAAPFFAPDNRNIATVSDERVTILRGDGRAHLLKRQGQFDIVVANTLHPWSLGATGLYSREYFERLSGALRTGGVAAQWLPLGVIGEEHLAAILRSFYAAFDHGALFWGAGNVMLVGSDHEIEPVSSARYNALAPLVTDALTRIGIGSVREFNLRRMADLAEINRVLGDGLFLTDDRPVLEARTYQRDHSFARDGENDLLHRIATEGRRASSERETVALWIESRGARSRGEIGAANRLEALAEAAGFRPARRARVQRKYASVSALIEAGDDKQALDSLESITREAPEFADAFFSIAKIEQGNENYRAAASALEAVVALQPMRGEAWNQLAVNRWRLKDLAGAQQAFARAIKAAPFLPEALAGAGGFALSRNDLQTARQMLARLDVLGVYGRLPEATALRQRLETVESAAR
ncbi:MAG: spermidine synthase [Myxococcota bacterium]